MKKLRITVEGKAYDVTVDFLDGDEVITTQGRAGGNFQVGAASYTSPVASAGVSAPVASSGIKLGAAPDGAVVSPLSGKVVSFDVTEGQSVKTGDQLVTIEAMKMNTFVNAPKDGKVTKISAAPGDAVEEGQTLVVIS